MNSNLHLHHLDHTFTTYTQVILAIPFFLAFIGYFLAVIISNSKHKRWPYKRLTFFVLGSLSALVAVVGPVSQRSHSDFVYHMVGHLLLGMLAPLLIALSTPIKLLLRTLSVDKARKLTSFLKSRICKFYTDPVVTSILNVGGLWFLYTTDLFYMMHQSVVLYVAIHLHVFLAGYLFTISMIYIDPIMHRRSFYYRSLVFIFALAGHGILSKHIYAHPPVGVAQIQTENGAILMYYLGDLIDAMIIFILCLQWYNSTRPRSIIQNNKLGV
ncbi:cytochrome c oxidase assembly protein [Bacillus sp. FJAT-45066]|uniref:cytochrome c oxidase assembly protein n=1 Tax=Bacillus sp. FJAT-45066 TaxID=2011010 RepID=UPI000BB99642|nr:cytochrome c oxidase assembly protein [Bacillus sp. FJAT-45066]